MSTYVNQNFTKHISGEIKTIVECGSRDCEDAIIMVDYYQPNVIYSFECNPYSVEICKHNSKKRKEIILIDKAVSDEDGTLIFHQTDMEKSIDKNIGASSVLIHHDNKIDFFQKKVEVECVRLETFLKNNNINNVDLLCLDLQGYERFAINGLGEYINKTTYIISEVAFRSFYENDILFDEYIKFMNDKGFEMIEFISYGDFGDALFKKIK